MHYVAAWVANWQEGTVRNSNKVCLAIFVLLVPGTTYANAGVPMLFLAMPAFLISLVPIIAVETFYLAKALALSHRQSLKTVSLSNVASTVIGIPLTWLVLVLVQMVTGGGGAYGIDTVMGKILAVTWQSPWLIPYEDDLDWMIPAAGLVLLIPFFFTSWWSEYVVSKWLNKSLRPESIKQEVRNANLITYSLLATWPIGFWVYSSAVK